MGIFKTNIIHRNSYDPKSAEKKDKPPDFEYSRRYKNTNKDKNDRFEVKNFCYIKFVFLYFRSFYFFDFIFAL